MNIVFVFIKSSFCPTHIPDVCFKILLQKKKLKVFCRKNVKYVCAKFLLKIGKLDNVRYLSPPSSHRLYLMFFLNSFCRRKNHKNLRVHPVRKELLIEEQEQSLQSPFYMDGQSLRGVFDSEGLSLCVAFQMDLMYLPLEQQQQ